MQLVFFLVYFILFAAVITKLSFFKNSGLSVRWLVILFVAKVGAGLAYAWFYSRLSIESADTWRYFAMSKDETDVLLAHPIDFIKDFFTYGYTTSGNLFGENSYWNDIKADALIKLMAVFNVFTQKNYYANLVFFNFFFFFGPVALFRLMMSYYEEKKTWLIIAIFFVPSFLFWCSGAHKDGLLFSALAVSIYVFNKQLQQRFTLKYVITILFCFAVLFVFRNFLLFLLIPAFFCWYVASRKPQYKWLIFSCVYAAGIVLFFTIPVFIPQINFPQYIITKQDEFKVLSGNSVIHVPPLLPTIKSFAGFFPSALDIAFLSPHINESLKPSYVASALENIFFILLIFAAIIFRNKKNSNYSYTVFVTFFCLSELILSGYTVTFSGSIMRYKSILLPFEASLLFTMIDFNFSKTKRLQKK